MGRELYARDIDRPSVRTAYESPAGAVGDARRPSRMALLVVSPEGQSACRLTIFRGVPDEDPVPLYDTGWMSCTRSTGVSLPAGECPTPEAGLYGWQVRIRDRSGNESRSKCSLFRCLMQQRGGQRTEYGKHAGLLAG